MQVKFCGLTSAADAEQAEALGADYAGVVFAGGPRHLRVCDAESVFHAVNHVGRVGVFASAGEELAAAVARLHLRVVQLHGDSSDSAIGVARGAGVEEVWGAVRVGADELPADTRRLFLHADAVVLDAKAAGALGGTGTTFDWAAVAGKLAEAREGSCGRLVLAGGLNPLNVARAIRALRPDIVDVSSGVESAPGVKDHLLMRRFAEAARSA